MTVELLFWEGCPSHPDALEDLRRILVEEGLAPEIQLREVTSDAQAQEERFLGSPTIRINGDDVIPPPDEETFGLTCRIYRTRDGRVSPVPDPEDVRDAVRRAA
jgi:hypothetical protein